MFWDSIPEHPLPGTPFQNILYLRLRSRTRTVIKGHAVGLHYIESIKNKIEILHLSDDIEEIQIVAIVDVTSDDCPELNKVDEELETVAHQEHQD